MIAVPALTPDSACASSGQRQAIATSLNPTPLPTVRSPDEAQSGIGGGEGLEAADHTELMGRRRRG